MTDVAPKASTDGPEERERSSRVARSACQTGYILT